MVVEITYAVAVVNDVPQLLLVDIAETDVHERAWKNIAARRNVELAHRLAAQYPLILLVEGIP